MLATAKERTPSRCGGAVCADLPLAVNLPLSENSPQGFATKNTALHQGFELRNSTTALGMRGTLALNRIGKSDRARYYDPNTGRFLSEDPIGFRTGEVNFYDYVANDPVDWVDASGHSRDNYVPDAGHHGGPHIDRYNPAGQNVGRYDPDGTPLKHKGKPSPPIPNSDKEKFKNAADKLKKKPETKCDQPKKMDNAQPDYFCAPGERFDCVPRPGTNPALPWWPVDPLVPGMPTVPVWGPEPIPVPI